jgi:hypothetical protein
MYFEEQLRQGCRIFSGGARPALALPSPRLRLVYAAPVLLSVTIPASTVSYKYGPAFRKAMLTDVKATLQEATGPQHAL